MKTDKIVPRSTFFDEVRSILAQARQKAYAAVNFAMIEAYWEIGRRIVEEEQQGKDRAEYGAALIKELSKQLTTEFGKDLLLPISGILGSFISPSPTFKNATQCVAF